jgi:hypothetical protein
MKASIPLERLEQVAREAGCTVKQMASYTLITKGSSKNCLFVAKTKNVSRIDVGGFDIPGEKIARALGGDSHGSVHMQFKTDMPDAVFLGNFREVCTKLDAYTPHERAPRQRPHGFPGTKHKPVDSVVVVSSSETPQQTIERLQAKIALIRRVSQEKRIPVSKKTEREIAEQIEKAKQEIGQSTSMWKQL